MSRRLRVDWPRCTGRGLCHELMPGLVTLDEWGYPVVPDVIGPEDLSDAREAVRSCPTLALRLVTVPSLTRTSYVSRDIASGTYDVRG